MVRKRTVHVSHEKYNQICAKRQEAFDILTRCGIDRGEDFHRLEASKVDLLIAEADKAKYRKPRNANGSRGRYFHDMLQRRLSVNNSYHVG